jgi:hypothetical protein
VGSAATAKIVYHEQPTFEGTSSPQMNMSCLGLEVRLCLAPVVLVGHTEPTVPGGPLLISFYYNLAPNPMKVALFLEEAGLAYELKPVDTRKGEQHGPL